jgi:hypothetical protein
MRIIITMRIIIGIIIIIIITTEPGEVGIAIRGITIPITIGIRITI